MHQGNEVRVMICTDPHFLAACPTQCFERLMNLLPKELTKTALKCRWVNLGLRFSSRVISGVALLDSCPTNVRATYLELYLGYFIPFVIKPDLQAVFHGDHLISCRYSMQRLWLTERCMFRDVKKGVSLKEALKIYRKLRVQESLPRSIPLLLLYTADTDEVHVFALKGEKKHPSCYIIK